MSNEMLNEKVSVNMNSSTLSSIDLLVDNGYYSNRSDFINQAVRDAIRQHQTTLDRIIEKNMQGQNSKSSWFIGVSGFTAEEIEQLYKEGKSFDLRGYGVFSIDKNCDREKLFAVLQSVQVRGKVAAPADIKVHYGIK